MLVYFIEKFYEINALKWLYEVLSTSYITKMAGVNCDRLPFAYNFYSNPLGYR